MFNLWYLKSINWNLDPSDIGISMQVYHLVKQMQLSMNSGLYKSKFEHKFDDDIVLKVSQNSLIGFNSQPINIEIAWENGDLESYKMQECSEDNPNVVKEHVKSILNQNSESSGSSGSSRRYPSIEFEKFVWCVSVEVGVLDPN